MPPPRFVRCNSTSLLRSVSIFSGKAGTVSATCGVGDGMGEASEAGDALELGAAVVAVGDEELIDGRRGACLATHHSHATSPMTQSMTTIHAVRSIKSGAAVIHKQEIQQLDGLEIRFAAAPDPHPTRPMADNAPAVSVPASFPARRHASPPPPENSANRSVQTGNRSPVRRSMRAAARWFVDRYRCKRAEFSASRR
jgi:hypothetical protein